MLEEAKKFLAFLVLQQTKYCRGKISTQKKINGSQSLSEQNIKVRHAQ